MMGSMAELDAKWRDAIEGMKFFDEHVQDMDAESLLRVIGYLVIENKRLEKQLRQREFNAIRIRSSGGYPVAE